MTGPTVAVVDALGVLFVLAVVGRLFRDVLHARWRIFVLALFVGMTAAAICLALEAAFFRWIGVFSDAVVVGAEASEQSASPEHLHGAYGGALLAMLLFSAPLEEGSKLLTVWPLHTRGKLVTRADSLYSALCAAGGFAMAEGVILAVSLEQSWLLGRLLLVSAGHLFFAGAWAFVLGDSSRRRRIRVTWTLATVFHGLYDHIALVRGEGGLVALAPVLLAMGALSAWGVRAVGALPRALQWVLPSSEDIEGVFRRPTERVALRWVVGGAFVNTGVVLVALIVAVILGHRIGIDFAAADEDNLRANGPLVLLGVAVLGAFPVAGYLVAKASGSRSLFVPAMGATLSLAALVIALAFAAPITAVFALPVAPVALTLTCVGAWFGLDR